jgi:hypothetical protein
VVAGPTVAVVAGPTAAAVAPAAEPEADGEEGTCEVAIMYRISYMTGF